MKATTFQVCFSHKRIKSLISGPDWVSLPKDFYQWLKAKVGKEWLLVIQPCDLCEKEKSHGTRSLHEGDARVC